MSELSEQQKFSRENFRGLIKIRKNRESFLTVKLLSFTVCQHSNVYLNWVSYINDFFNTTCIL